MKDIHYVYKIMNLVNGKFYIGKHSSDSIEDEYFGSGVGIGRAIAKYGIENFSKSIIASFNTPEEAYSFEAEIVTLELVRSDMCYNYMVGGDGAGCGEAHHMYGKTHTKEARSKISAGNKGRRKTDSERKQISERQRGVAPECAISSNRKRVTQLSLDGKVIRTFDSVCGAARALRKGSHANISLCANGKQRKAYGYKWKYES